MMKQKGFAPIILLLLVALLAGGGYYVYKNFNLTPKVTTQVPSPVPTSISNSTSDWKTYSFDFCGTNQSKAKFSIDIPNNWILTQKSEAIWASYTFTDSKNSFDVSCGEGFGNNCEPPYQTSYLLNGKSYAGCYKNGIGGIFVENNKLTYALTGKADKKLLTQILSTFKFADQVACTMEAKVCPDGSSVGRTGPNCEFAPCP